MGVLVNTHATSKRRVNIRGERAKKNRAVARFFSSLRVYCLHRYCFSKIGFCALRVFIC